MNLCIPIDENRGLNSRICLHFGTAPKLLVVDPQTMAFEIFDNPDAARKDPQKVPHFLSQNAVKSVVVGGIGLAALDHLHSAGISVFSSTEDTVSEIVHAFNSGTINPVTLGKSCHQARGEGRGFSVPVCDRNFRGHRGGNCSGGC